MAVINYAGPDNSGNVTVSVRSQAEIILSGKDSDDRDGPILQYLWEVADAGGTGLTNEDLLVRDRASVNLSVPRVDSATTIRLRLTVTASDGGTDSAEAVVNVLPAGDSNAFLQYPGAAAAFGLVVTTNGDRAASSAAATYRVRVERRVKYRPRSASSAAGGLVNYCAAPQASWPQAAWTDDSQSWLPEPGFDGAGETGQYVIGQWNEGAGTIGLQAGVSAAVNAPQNPRYFFPIPSLNADDVNRHYRSVSAPLPARQLKGADIDDAMVEVRITVEPTGVAPDVAFVLINEGGAPILDSFGQPVTASNSGSGGAATLVVDAEVLRRGANAESRLTAQAYYCAIDPEGRRLTFSDWLVTNGFDPTATDFGADPIDAPGARPHAIYVNNYDLGFGRDMYMKRTATGCTGASDVKQNVSGVVVNYPSLEAAVRRTGAFIAVAMEYALKDPLGSECDPANRMTTFYAYVPDDDGDADNDGIAEGRQGLPAYRRVLSANFDGRGEKYVPGSCTACHGGSPWRALNPDGTYPDKGDLQATFLPWDPDSLLYASDGSEPNKADPSFSQAPEDAELRSKYSREAQAATLREFNRIAYSTYPDPAIQQAGKYPFAHFDGPRRLIEGWYGSSLSGNYNASFVPAGWLVTGVNGINPADIYRNVVAQNCRACHLQQVQGPPSDSLVNRPAQFTTWGDFMSYATPLASQSESLLQRHVFSTAVMPGSRLTSDRFWLPDAGSAGEQLAEVLRAISGASEGPGRPGAPKVSPSLPSFDVGSQGGTCSSGSTPDEVVCSRGQWVTINAAPASFVRQQDLEWEVRRLSGDAECSVSGLSPLGAETAANGTSRFAMQPLFPGLFCVTVAARGSLLKTWRIFVPDRYPELRENSPIPVVVGTPVSLVATHASGSGAIEMLSVPGDGESRIAEVQGVARQCPFSGVAVSNGGVVVGTLGCDTTTGVDRLGFTPLVSQPNSVTFSVAIVDSDGSRAQPFGFQEGVATPSQTSTLAVTIQYQASVVASDRTYILDVDPGKTSPDAEPLPILSQLIPPAEVANWRVRITEGATRTPSPAAIRTGLTEAGSLSGTLNTLQSSVTYLRPPRTATMVNNTSRTPEDHVHFSFNLVRVGAGETVLEEVTGFTGTIRLRSTQSASVPRAILTAPKCSGSCHSENNPSGGLLWAGASALDVHSILFTGAPPTLCPSSLVDTSNPAGSCLFTAVGPVGSNHAVSGRNTLTASEVEAIKVWIEQGSMELLE